MIGLPKVGVDRETAWGNGEGGRMKPAHRCVEESRAVKLLLCDPRRGAGLQTQPSGAPMCMKEDRQKVGGSFLWQHRAVSGVCDVEGRRCGTRRHKLYEGAQREWVTVT